MHHWHVAKFKFRGNSEPSFSYSLRTSKPLMINNLEWHFNWAINGDWCGHERAVTRSVCYWQLRIMDNNLSCECFGPDLRLRTCHVPSQHARAKPILSLQAKLNQYLIKKSVSLMNNKIWSSNKKVCKMFNEYVFKHLAFNPAHLKHDHSNDKEFRAAWGVRVIKVIPVI